MKIFKIGKNDEGQRLDKFLSRLMADYPMSHIYKSLRKKKVKVNSKRITDGAYRLVMGDILELYISDEYFSSAPQNYNWMDSGDELKIVYEDEHIIIADKPSGLLSQSDDEDSLEGRIRKYLYNKGEFNPKEENSFIPSLCHRIDRNTKGLVIGAKDMPALRTINEKIRLREIRKFYLLETQGTPSPIKGEISGWLEKDSAKRKMILKKNEVSGGVFCKTLYRVLKEGSTALVEAELLTGRTHQIRAGFSAIGTPLKGDVKYGAKKDGKTEFQHLTAYKLIFDFKDNNGCLDYLKGKEFTTTG